MSIIKCHECGGQVSTEAQACPTCGAKPQKPKRSNSKLILALVGTIVIVGLISGHNDKIPVKQPLTPEQIKDKELQTQRFARAQALEEMLKTNLRDPDSLRIDTLLMDQEGNTICAEYRARNGFGGFNKEYITITKGKGKDQGGQASKTATAWNKHCTQNNLFDMMWALKRK